MATLKTCFKCGNEKERTEFYRHKKMADGLLGKCKECTKMDMRDHREENLESARLYDRARGNDAHRVAARIAYQKTERGKAAVRRAQVAYKKRFPDRSAARISVNNALRNGDLLRQPCWVCGARAHAHHPDYSRPLDVVWLCHVHHRATHALVA